MVRPTAGWSFVLAAAACSAQRTEQEAPSVEAHLTTARLPCAVAAGDTILPGEKPSRFSESGPDLCVHVLDKYLAENAEARIVSVIPIEYAVPVDEKAAQEPGTQELLVVLADGGPWPQARSIQTTVINCSAVGRGPKSCGAAILSSAALAKSAVFWVPLANHVDKPTSEAGTQHVIIGFIREGTPASSARGEARPSGQ